MSDILLDDVARAMTEVEAPADLRARVLSEIGRPRLRRWSGVLFPLTAAASVGAVWLFAMHPLVTDLQVPAAPSPLLAQFAAGDPRPTTTSVTATTADSRRPDAATSADELAWLSRSLPVLETRALFLEQIQPAAPAITPISVEPIALEPISLPPPGAGSGDRR